MLIMLIIDNMNDFQYNLSIKKIPMYTSKCLINQAIWLLNPNLIQHWMDECLDCAEFWMTQWKFHID